MKGNTKWWIAGAIALALIGGALVFGLSGNNAAAQTADTAGVETITAFMGDLAASAVASGQLLPRRRATLSGNGRVVDDVLIREGDTVAAGDLLVRLDTADLMLNAATAEQNLAAAQARLDALYEAPSAAELAAAEAELASAAAALADLQAGPDELDLATAEADVRAANASIQSASGQLSQTRNTVTQADIEAAKAELVAAEYQLQQIQNITEDFSNDRLDDSLTSAREAYAQAQAKYTNLLNGADVNSVGESQAGVSAAVARRDNAQASLNDMMLGATAAEIADAEYRVAQAEANLDDLTAEPSTEDIRIAEAEVAQAELNLENAEESLADAQLTAPFAGVVTVVHYNEGELASGPVVEIVDNNALDLVLSVDEVDIGSIAVGQPADVTLETWRGETIASEVQTIAPAANETSTGAITYDVRVRLGETDLPVRIGMTADARLITDSKTDVLLVPNAAVRADRSTGTYYVAVVQADGTAEEVEITIGLNDNRYTQVVGGIEAGAELLLNYTPADVGNSQQGGGPPGGGPPGGGGPFG